MAEFRIYQSEFAVRAENVKLKQELAALRADCNRLREIVGEEQLQTASHAPATAAGETFKSGNCTVTIGSPGKPPVMNQAMIQSPMVRRQPAQQPALSAGASDESIDAELEQQAQAIVRAARPAPPARKLAPVPKAPTPSYAASQAGESERVQHLAQGKQVDSDDSTVLRFSMVEPY